MINKGICLLKQKKLDDAKECFDSPITGQDGKMSSSKADATIFLTDDKETLRKKIMKKLWNALKNH